MCNCDYDRGHEKCRNKRCLNNAHDFKFEIFRTRLWCAISWNIIIVSIVHFLVISSGVMWSSRGYCSVLLRAILVFACADAANSQKDNSEILSVGKIRASADLAFSKGEIDNAIKLWGKVQKLCFPYF